MSLGADGSPESIDSAILTDNKSSLQQPLVTLQIERRFLYQYIAAQQQRIEELEAHLKRYENAHTPPSEQGGAAGSSGGGASSGGDEETETDDTDSAVVPLTEFQKLDARPDG